MQSPAASPSSQSAATFAGLLASLTATNRKPPAGEWNDEELEDDVATLSYEKALRAHARYRPARQPAPPVETGIKPGFEAGVGPRFETGVEAGSLRIREAPVAELGAEGEAGKTAVAEPPPEPQLTEVSAKDRKLLSASITIRLSQEECAQLRKRAAEAGLTVSAYLRSCTFEAESLRAMVKDTLVQMRAQASARKSRQARPRRRWRDWMNRLWPHDEEGEQAAEI